MNKLKIGSYKELNKLDGFYNNGKSPCATIRVQGQKVGLVVEDIIQLSLMEVNSKEDLHKLVSILKAFQFDIEIFDLKAYLKDAISLDSCYADRYFQQIGGEIRIEDIDFSYSLPFGTYKFAQKQNFPTIMEIEETLNRLKVTEKELCAILREME